MRTLFLAILTLFCAAPARARPKPLKVYLWATYESLRDHPSLDWEDTHLDMLMISLPRQGIALSDPATTEEGIRDCVRLLKDAAGNVPLGIWYWGYAERLTWSDPLKLQAQWTNCPPDVRAVVKERLGWLGKAARAQGVRMLVMDSEIYPYAGLAGQAAKAQGSGGPMHGPAWRNTPESLQFAADYARALAGTPLGTWVLWSDAKKFTGFRSFWKRAGLAYGMPEETFYDRGKAAGAAKSVRALGARPIAFVWKNYGKIGEDALVNLCRAVADAERTSEVLLYDQQHAAESAEVLEKLGRVVRRLHNEPPRTEGPPTDRQP